MVFGRKKSEERLQRAGQKKHEKKHGKQDVRLFENAIIRWKAPEFDHHEKSTLWFIIAGLVVLLLVFYGLKTDGWTFSVAILVFAGTYYLLHREKPKVVDIKISKIGVKIGRHIFHYSHLKNFWVVYNPPFVQRLYLKSTSKLHPDIFVSLEDADPMAVKHILKDHIPELKGANEPFADVLVRIFKL
ncbi:MAG: hypothetical protein WCT53_01880 [Candidatus Gracilibacteria bacterium]